MEAIDLNSNLHFRLAFDTSDNGDGKLGSLEGGFNFIDSQANMPPPSA